MKANRKTDICIFTIRSRVKYSAAAFQLNKMSLISTVSRFIHALSYKWNHNIIVLPYSVSFICFIILQHHFRFCRYFVVVVVIAGCFCSFGTWTACTVCTIFPSFFLSFKFICLIRNHWGRMRFGFEKITSRRFTEWNEMNNIHQRISIALHLLCYYRHLIHALN